MWEVGDVYRAGAEEVWWDDHEEQQHAGLLAPDEDDGEVLITPAADLSAGALPSPGFGTLVDPADTLAHALRSLPIPDIPESPRTPRSPRSRARMRRSSARRNRRPTAERLEAR